MSDFTVELMSAAASEAIPDRSEAQRYMGYKNYTPDEASKKLIDVCEKELLAVVRPLCCFGYTDIEIINDSTIKWELGTINSCELASHLSGCTGAYLFAATIGIGADRLIAKYSRIMPAKSVITDALGSASIESYCDTVEKRITKEFSSHRWRFSPGYGDFSLEYQRDFMRYLDMSRKLGITLTDSLLMTPTKSVTAIVGVCSESAADDDRSKRVCRNKCADCGNISCVYRTYSRRHK